MPAVSVIIPIFNVEKYIEKCARSLMEQTFDDIEYIFVNDATEDGSMDILYSVVNEYPHRIKQVKYVTHDVNKGLPTARHTGLMEASGEYVIHCDSDDWVDKEYCSKLLYSAEQNNADIVVCDYYISDRDSYWNDSSYNDYLLEDSTKAFGAVISLQSSPYLWNKLIRRSIFKDDIIYPTVFLAEDWVLSVQSIHKAKRIIVIDEKLYFYYKNPSSSRWKYDKLSCLKRVYADKSNVLIICQWLKSNKEYYKHIREVIARKALTKQILFPVSDIPECRKIWRLIFREDNIPIMFCNILNMAYKRKHIFLLLGIYPMSKKIYQWVIRGKISK